MKRYRHLFFDLDHTLWDFESNSKTALAMLYEHHGLESKGVASLADFQKVYARINEEKWEAMRRGTLSKQELRNTRFAETLQHCGAPDAELAGQLERDYLATAPSLGAVMPHAIEVLTYLHEHYALHIITNGFQEVQSIKMETSGLSPFFQTVITSEAAGAPKPLPRIFVYAMQQTGARRKESLMVGDRADVDVAGAKRCGIDQVYYNPDAQFTRWKPTYTATSLRDLMQWL
jgi:putative hydrolase of the HAD superfamily